MRTLNAVILVTAVVGGVCGCRSTPPAAAVSDKAAAANKVIACGSIQDETERYRCYDGVNASMRPATAGRVVAANSAPVVSPATPVVAAARAATASSPQSAAATGASAPTLAGTGSAPKAASAPASKAPVATEDRVGEEYLAPKDRRTAQAPSAVHSSIASVDEVRPTQYVIKLANGQVWRHTGAQTMAFFRAGDDVNIEREMLGSYHMWSKATGGNTNWVRVTRVE
jgi:hypothetical protein